MNRLPIPLAALLLLAGCANVPIPTDPLTPESIVGTYSLRQVNKNVTVTGGATNPAAGNFAGSKGVLALTKDSFAGSFSIPQEAVADTLTGAYTLTNYPYGAGGYAYTPSSPNPKGFAGFTYQANTITVFYRANPGIPYTTYVLTYGRP